MDGESNKAREISYIALPEIIIGDRARKEMGDFKALVKDIETRGILQSITVLRQADGKFKLLAGERRLKAAEKLGLDSIPAIICENIDELEELAIELSENTSRLDFSWEEEVQLRYAIDSLERKSHIVKNKKWTSSDTARKLGIDKGQLSRDLKLAEALKVVPELKHAKDKNEAHRILSNLASTYKRAMTVEKIEKKQKDTGLEKLKGNLAKSYVVLPTIKNDSLRSGFLFEDVKLPKGHFDICHVDPPFSIELPENRKGVNRSKIATTGYKEIKSNIYPEFIKAFIQKCWNCSKEDAWLIFWFAPHPWFEVVRKTIEEVGYKVYGVPSLWYRTGVPGQTRRPDLRLASSYESFFYARKGKARIKGKQGRSNIFEFKPVSPINKIHPTEKPVELLQEVLATFTNPGENLLDPCTGSGNALLAGANLRLEVTGFDITHAFREGYVTNVFSDNPGSYKSY